MIFIGATFANTNDKKHTAKGNTHYYSKEHQKIVTKPVNAENLPSPQFKNRPMGHRGKSSSKYEVKTVISSKMKGAKRKNIKNH